MADNSKIEWTDHTFNPWWGCQKVGPGCDHCYAEALDKRFGGDHWGPGKQRRRTSEKNWHEPTKWNEEAWRKGKRFKVFCASMADIFDNAVPDEWRHDVWDLIRRTPNLDWLLLTKRVGNVQKMLPADWGSGYHNVWLGITVVNQEEADRDIPKLMEIPARVRFLSMEPLLGPVNLERIHESGVTENGGGWHSWESCLNGRRFDPWSDGDVDGYPKIDWVIVGGESGRNARPMHPDWVKSLRDQCEEAAVPFLFKQWGNYRPFDFARDRQDECLLLDAKGNLDMLESGMPNDNWGEAAMISVGKKQAGRLLDGIEWNQMPEAAL